MESPRIIRGPAAIYFTLAMIYFPHYPKLVPSKLSLIILVLKLIAVVHKPWIFCDLGRDVPPAIPKGVWQLGLAVVRQDRWNYIDVKLPPVVKSEASPPARITPDKSLGTSLQE
jgi:hypothetical protein